MCLKGLCVGVKTNTNIHIARNGTKRVAIKDCRKRKRFA